MNQPAGAPPTPPFPWRPDGPVSPGSLSDARAALHWAASVPAAIGARLAPAESDWVQLSSSWRAAERDLLTRPAPGSPPVRAALAPADRELRLVDPHGQIVDRFALTGRALADARAWFAEALAARGAPVFEPVENDELPAHPFGAGAPFAVDERAAAALGGLYGAANERLARAARSHGGTPVPRMWPHHFDLDVLVPMGDAGVGEDDSRAGLGFSPGDAGNPLPYFYATLFFATGRSERPNLAGGGTWNEGGWFGARLPFDALRADEEVAQIDAFLESAVAAGRALSS